MIEPPVLVQFAKGTFLGTSGSVNIAYQNGDTILVLAADGNAFINSVADSGGSSFVQQSGNVWQIWTCLSAKASSSVTVHASSSENFSVIIAVFRRVSGLIIGTPSLGTSGTVIPVTQTIAAGSKLVGMIGQYFNAGGSATLSGDNSGKTAHGDLRVQVGEANVHPLVGLVDADGSMVSNSTITLQLTASRASTFNAAVSIELQGITPTYPLYQDLFVTGDGDVSVGGGNTLAQVHGAVSLGSKGFSIKGSKGVFPCFPQLGGASANLTYQFNHLTTRFSFTYGTIEAQIKFAGYGVHNQVWMLGVPSRPWPDGNQTGGGPWPNPPGGVIDIAEIGVNDDYVHVRQAYANPTWDITDTLTAFDPTADFHTYKLVWAAGSLTWYIDGTQVKTASSAVPNYPMYVLFGGYMGEYTIDDTLLPQFMQIKSLSITDANGNPVSNSGNANIIPPPPPGSGGLGIPSLAHLLAGFGGMITR